MPWRSELLYWSDGVPLWSVLPYSDELDGSIVAVSRSDMVPE